MTMEHRIKEPFTKEKMKALRAGDSVLLTGTIYTARDAAHKRMIESLQKGEALPFAVEDSIIYYVGPTPAKEGMPIGSAGPTTSYRMDDLTIPLLERGLKVMIGKGKRSEAVIDSMIKNKCVYLIAIGGAGAYISNSIKKCEVIAFEDLGCESVKKLYIEDFPLIVANDCNGGDIFSEGRNKYAKI